MVHTKRGEVIRIISARRSTEKEVERYEQVVERVVVVRCVRRAGKRLDLVDVLMRQYRFSAPRFSSVSIRACSTASLAMPASVHAYVIHYGCIANTIKEDSGAQKNPSLLHPANS